MRRRADIRLRCVPGVGLRRICGLSDQGLASIDRAIWSGRENMRLMLCAAALGGVVLATAPASAAVTEDAFLARSTGDLVTLCSADRSDPLYTAAQNFCHGFAVGTYQTLSVVQSGMRSKKKLFCLPAAPPSRNEGIAAFVRWAGLHNDAMATPPIDGVLQFLTQQYPCN